MTTLVSDPTVLVNDPALTVDGETWAAVAALDAPDAAPTVTSFLPTSGTVGTYVVITGTGFNSTVAVRINVTAVIQWTVDSDTQISALVPSGASAGKITVQTSSGSASSSQVFTVTVPSIVSFAPLSGEIGSLVGINGSGFTRVTSGAIGGVAASIVVIDDTRVVMTIPVGAVTATLSLTSPEDTAYSADEFSIISLPVRNRRRIGDQDKDLEKLGISIGYR